MTPQPIDNKTIRILLAEDDADTARSTHRLLTRAGYTVAHVTTGAEVLEHVRRHRPDLVLQDRNLPDGDGLDICRQIKADPSLRNVFVVMISSSYTSKAQELEGLEGGADGYISRPVSNDELLARVAAFVRIVKLSLKLRESNEALHKLVEAHREAEAEAARLLELAEQSSRALSSVAEDQAAAVESLRESEEQFRELAQSLAAETQRLHDSQAVASVGSWETNLATLDITWTPETYRIFEVSPETFRPTHQRFLDLVHPQDRAKVHAAFIHSRGSARRVRCRASDQSARRASQIRRGTLAGGP